MLTRPVSTQAKEARAAIVVKTLLSKKFAGSVAVCAFPHGGS